MTSSTKIEGPCPHLEKDLVIKPRLNSTMLQQLNCEIHIISNCKNVWCCAYCEQMYCAKDTDAKRHALDTGHKLILRSTSDKDIWCKACKDYVPVKRSVKNKKRAEDQSDKKNPKKKRGPSLKLPKITALKKKLEFKKKIVEPCPHFDKDLDIRPKLFIKMLKEHRCESHSRKSQCKNLWFCTRCEQAYCGGNKGSIKPPAYNAMQHDTELKHCLVMQSNNNKKFWCLLCKKYIRVSRKVSDEKKYGSKTPREKIKDYPRTILKSITRTLRLIRPCRYHIRGMSNLESTCYYSVILQNLLSLDLLRDHYTNGSFARESFCDMMRNLYLATGPNSSTENLRNELYPLLYAIRGQYVGQFDGYRHHDSQEFLLALLSCMMDEEAELDRFIETTFRLEIFTRLVCSKCKHVDDNTETLYNFMLLIPCRKIKGGPPENPRLKFERGETSGFDTKNDDVVDVMESGSAGVSGVDTKVDDVEGVEESGSAGGSGVDTKVDVEGVKESGFSGVSGVDREVAEVAGVRESRSAGGSGVDTKIEDVAAVEESGSAEVSEVDPKLFAASLRERNGKSIATEPEDDVATGDDVAAVEETGSDDLLEVDPKVVAAALRKRKGNAIARNPVNDVAAVEESGFPEVTEVDPKAVAGALRECKGKEIATAPEYDDDLDDVRRYKVDSSYLLGTKTKSPLVKRDVKGTSNLFEPHNITHSIKAQKRKSKASQPYLLGRKTTSPLIVGGSTQETVEGRDDLAELYKRAFADIASNRKAASQGPSSLEGGSEPKVVNIFKWLYQEKILKRYRKPKSFDADDEDYEVDNSNGEVSIESLLAGILGTKKLPEDNSCKKCKKPNADSFFNVSCGRAPRILVLHLMRFYANGALIHKIHGHVAFKEKMVFGQYMRDKSKPNDVVYKLMGIVEHKGGGSSSGHYIAYVRGGCPGDDWFCADDRRVTKATLVDVLERDAFLLFYQRIDR